MLYSKTHNDDGDDDIGAVECILEIYCDTYDDDYIPSR